MEKKSLSEWIAIIICLLPSPIVIMFLFTIVGVVGRHYQINLIWPLLGALVIGFVILRITIWLLSKLVYFIIK
jgi:hypothetical protein